MVLLSACALCAAFGLAPTPAPSATPTPLPQIAHVYTADRSDATLKNTARTIYVVTREEIAQHGYRTVAEALSDIPALTLFPHGPFGSTVDFTLRGSTSAQVLVLVDGLPAPGSFSNTVELGNLPTAGVDRIEIVEGGGSTLYGTGAVGGVINIITDRSAGTSAALRIGSFGDREISISTPNVQFSRALASNDFAVPGGVRSDVDYQTSALHVNGQRRIGSFELAARAGIEADHLGAPGPEGAFLSPSSRENDVNQNADVTLTRKTPQAESTMQAGATNQRILFSCDASIDPNCAYPTAALSTEGRVDVGARNAVRGADEELLYGIDLSRGVVRSDSGGTASPPIVIDALAQSAAYVQERVDTQWGSYYGGMRAERDGSLGGELSPSGGFLWRLSSVTTLKGNVATAFRAPNASELYFPAYGNPALKPERGKVADVTIADARIGGGASLSWFANRTNDLIVAEPVSRPGAQCAVDQASYTYEPCNIDRAFIEGLTFAIRSQLRHGMTASFNMTDLYRAQDIDAQRRLPNDPVVTANLALNYAAQSARSLVGAWGTLVRVAGTGAPYTTVDAFVRLRAARHVLATFRGYNLGNERYAAVSGYPMPGRSFVFELSTRP